MASEDVVMIEHAYAPLRTPLAVEEDIYGTTTPQPCRVYKRRFFGLAQLVALNIVCSWSWLTFAAVADTSAQYFRVSITAINWLSTGFLFAFLLTCPIVLLTLHKHSPKPSIVAASVLISVGSWLRYAGTKAGTHGNFPLVVVSQFIIGTSQPFVLASPTRYSEAWFSPSTRVVATALSTLANPLGGALAQLFSPLLSSSAPSTIPNLVLYTSIISTVACLPAIFLPSLPPTPPSHSLSDTINDHLSLPLRTALKRLLTLPAFYYLAIPFVIYVSAFNSTATLLSQILIPYGFSEDQAGLAGACLILVGLVFSAIVSPLVDRTSSHLLTIKLLVPLVAISYNILIFIPQTKGFAAVCVTMGLVGASSFALLPCALEYMTKISAEIGVGAEVSSVLAWACAQGVAGGLLLGMDALRDDANNRNMHKALILQCVLAWVVVPLPVFLLWKSKRTT